MSLDFELVRQLREMARRGVSICDMALHICEVLGVGNSRMDVIAYLREAFGIGLAELMPVGAWTYFPGGTWSREQVEAEVMPVIMRHREQWDRD